MIINGENLILGRLATFTAKKALQGEKIDIVNCEKIVVTGDRVNTKKHYKKRVDRGTPLKGPFYPKVPDRFVRRAIRGMLPYKQERGEKAFKRIMCHISIPDKFKDQKLETLDNANILKTKNFKFTTVSNICKSLKK